MVGLPGDNGDGLSFLTEVLEESPGVLCIMLYVYRIHLIFC